jgi:hypothetical protein
MQEPAYKELVLLYNVPNGDADDIPNLQLKIYGKIPIPDLKVCLQLIIQVAFVDDLNVDSHNIGCHRDSISRWNNSDGTILLINLMPLCA